MYWYRMFNFLYKCMNDHVFLFDTQINRCLSNILLINFKYLTHLCDFMYLL